MKIKANNSTIQPIYVCGHKNPDTDSICAAWSYASLKNKIMGAGSAVAIRCGHLPKQTKFIFDNAKVNPPTFLKNITLTVSDVMNKNHGAIVSHAPLNDVLHLIDETGLQVAPVVTEENRFIGLVNVNMLMKRFLGVGLGRTEVLFHPKNLENMLGSPPLYTSERIEDLYSLVIGTHTYETFTKRLSQFDPKKTVLIAGDRTEIIQYAIDAGVAIIILSNIDSSIHTNLSEKYRAENSWLFTSPYDTIESYRRLILSMPVTTIMNDISYSLPPDANLREASFIFSDHNKRGIPILSDGVLEGIVTRTDLIEPEKKKIILVDHNELPHAVDGADTAEIVEVIDHHRIGSLSTSTPITIYAKPVGSTCTLVYEKFVEAGISPDPQEAIILLSGILSDTLALKSPTATSVDEKAIEALYSYAGLNSWRDYANILFSNSGNLKAEEPNKLINADLKVYTEKTRTVGISQVEVVDMNELEEMRHLLQKALTEIQKERKLDWAMLLITDIIHGCSVLITTGNSSADALLKYQKIENNFFDLEDVLSRKKQLLPEVIRVLELL